MYKNFFVALKARPSTSDDIGPLHCRTLCISAGTLEHVREERAAPPSHEEEGQGGKSALMLSNNINFFTVSSYIRSSTVTFREW